MIYLCYIILTINTCVHPRYVYIFDVMMDESAYLYMTCLCCIVVFLFQKIRVRAALRGPQHHTMLGLLKS